MSTHRYIACDLGAESGRIILGTFQEGRLTLEEMHRFPNDPVRIDGGLRWDVPRLFAEMKAGLARVAAHLRDAGIGSVKPQRGLLGRGLRAGARRRRPLALPYHYRDPRTEAAFMPAMETVPAETIFAETGIQFMPINTLYQILAHRSEPPEQLARGGRFLLIADYFHSLFSGVAVAERSLASTTQLYNPRDRALVGGVAGRICSARQPSSRRSWTPGRCWGR